MERDNHGASFEGVPTHCWCGNRVTTFVSRTSRNPFRRFYICNISTQREDEAHLFKWVDDALLEEVNRVDARQGTVERGLESLVNPDNKVVTGDERSSCLGAITWLCSKFR
ncbi:hypothetical protein N665_0721s0012 [Sinapis alba]|nr:hypothetical protein N665_0721s0012 [Sinapis alba]